MKQNLKRILTGLSAFAIISTTPVIVGSYSLNPPKLVVQTEDKDIHVDVNNKNDLEFVYARLDNKTNMSKIVIKKGNDEKILTQGYKDYFPFFNPDGDKIVFFRETGFGVGYLGLMNADGKNLEELTVANLPKPSWSPDGKTIVLEDMLTEKEDYIITQKDIENLKKTYNTDGIGYKPGDKIKIDVQYFLISILDVETKEIKYITEKSKGFYSYPEFTQDGRIIYLFQEDSNSDQNELWIMNSDGSNKKLFFKPKYQQKEHQNKNESGSTIYVTKEKIFQFSIDGDNMAILLGIEKGIKKTSNQKVTNETYSEVIYIMDIKTKELKLITDEGNFWFPELKNNKLYFSRYDDMKTKHNIYSIDLE